MERNLDFWIDNPDYHQPINRRKDHRSVHRCKVFYPWMVPAMRQHLREGYSFNYFWVRFNIMESKWMSIVRSSQELTHIKNEWMKRKNRRI